jgi:hypothetical protein
MMAGHCGFSKINRHGRAFPAIDGSVAAEFWDVDARPSIAKTRFALLAGHDVELIQCLLTKP